MNAKINEKQGTAVSKERTGKRKFLSRLGTFLLMGGWLLVLFLVLGIVIFVSILFR